MRTLVTGGAGFIGGHLVDALVDAGHDVTVLDSLDPRVHAAHGHHAPTDARFIHGDITDARTLHEALAPQPEVVYHDAAMVGLGRGAHDAEDFMHTNVTGTIRLMHALARLERPPRVVLASTMAVYGEGAYRCPDCQAPRPGVRHPTDLDAGRYDPRCPSCDTPLVAEAATEEHTARPATIYAISKLAQEHTALSMGHARNVPVVALRYHNVYGARMPRDTPYAGVAALFRSRVLAGQPPLVHEDGAQLRDFVHVDDIVRANLLAATAPHAAVDGQAFNIGTGQPRPIMDLAEELTSAAGIPDGPSLSGTYRPGDARHVYASIEKARRVLGYTPRVTFENGVQRFLGDPARAPPHETVT